MKYDYRCPMCGLIESTLCEDTIGCRCGSTAMRIRSFAVNRSSMQSQSRWDPVVGEYVRNDREFRDKLAQGQEAQAAKLGMEVKLETVDARDSDALASLHGHSAERREHDLEGTRKAAFDRSNA